MGDAILFLLLSPIGVPFWVFLIAWLSFKLNVFWFLNKKETEINWEDKLPDWDDPIYK